MHFRGRHSAAAVFVSVALAGAFGGCTSGTASVTGKTTTGSNRPAQPTTTTVRTCRPDAGYEPGTTMHHLVVRGANRVFLVHMPPHPGAAMRLVVDFHGAGSDMHQQDIYSGFDPVADAHGFVVASPNGADAAIRQWRYFNDDDTSFAVAIVRELALHACVDPAHAYAVGISSGAGMTASLACQASDTFAGFGPVAADVYFPALCAKAKVRPIIIFHGTADPVVPYYGGHIGGPNGLRIAPAEQTAAAWAKHNGCTAGAAQTRLSSQVVTLTWKGCKAPVVMYRIVGGGHTWPGSAIELPALGLTTHQVSATAQMWKLFSSIA
ncbi:MAG TPA: PHB depolymerase family esterase [Acidimicrobiia bacterium]|nr:PHB depolymerase family esterase [Acidimicrobiia bacterium]